jgi:transposase
MQPVIERCAGLDVHQATVMATVRVPDGQGGRREVTETFRTTTAALLTLRDWLQAYGVTDVAMESTGVYWKPVYYLLQDRFNLLLVNAEHLKQVPGRKSDVRDSAWIAQLLEWGLLRASFVPPPPIRDLRDLTGTGNTRFGTGRARSIACTKSWKMPASNSVASPPT